MPYLSLTTTTAIEGSVTSHVMVIVAMMYPESFYYFGHSSGTVSHSVRHSDLIVCAVVPAVVLGRCDIIVGAAAGANARDAHDSSQCRRRRRETEGTDSRVGEAESLCRVYEEQEN